MPVIVAVPSPLSVKLKPLGSVPVRASAGETKPVVVMLKELFTPTWNVAWSALVMADDSKTVSATGRSTMLLGLFVARTTSA